MVYSAVETTCFGLYWPSSGFYNIEMESINAVKSARAICKHGEKYINRETSSRRCGDGGGVILLGLHRL